MEVKKGYKKTEIGVFPEDWEIKELGKCLQSRPDYGIGAPAVNYKDSLPIYLRITDISEQGKFIKGNITSVDNPSSENYLLNINEIVVARTGASVGKSYLYNPSDGKLVFAGFLIRLKPINEEVNSRYLFELTQTNYYKSWINSNSMRSGQPGVNSNELASFQIPIPPLPEQKAIATALSDMDALIAQTEKLIEKKKAMKQGMMQELLKPKKGWVTKKLGEVCEIIGGGTPSTTNASFWNGDINWFTPTEVGEDKYLYTSKRRISGLGLASCSARILPAGTILLTTRAGIGDLGILRNDAATNQGFQSLLPRAGVHYEFVYYMMHTKKSELLQNASGSTFLEISPRKLKSIDISIPSISIQKEIAGILQEIDSTISLIETKLQKLKLQKQGMMQELLTGRIRLL